MNGESSDYDYNSRRYSSDAEPLIQEKHAQEPNIEMLEKTRQITPVNDNSDEDVVNETPQQRRIRLHEESELFSQLSKIVKLPRKSKTDILARAKAQIETLNAVSADLQKGLHMEMSKNQQLKKELEKCKQPPIKLKIQHGKSILQNSS